MSLPLYKFICHHYWLVVCVLQRDLAMIFNWVVETLNFKIAMRIAMRMTMHIKVCRSPQCVVGGYVGKQYVFSIKTHCEAFYDGMPAMV